MHFAVIGHPIAHSLSPMLHETWLKAAGLFGCYTMVDVEAESIGIVRSAGTDHVNWTESM